LPEIVQDIGAYAGLASVVGLAVLAALYFSQARDVKRLREWAGRAPERAEQGTPAVPGRMVAQPQRTGAPAVSGGPKPGPPAVPGAKPGAPAAPGAPKPAAPGRPGPAAPVLPGAAPATASARPAAATAAGARPATATAQGPANEASEPDSAAADDERGAGAATATEEPVGASDETAAGSPAPGDTSADGPPAAAPTDGPPAAAPAGAMAGAAAAGAAGSSNSWRATQVAGANAGRPAAPPVPGARPQARPGGPGRVVPQHTAILAPPPREPWYRRLTANPLYVVLAVAGVLIVGSAAVFGVMQLVGDDEGGGTAQGPQQAIEEEPNGGGGGDQEQPRRRGGGAGVNPANVTVAVLNGTTVPGLAATIMDQAEEAGFRAGTVANFLPNQQLGESVVQYTPGHEREAAAVSRRLQIAQREAVNPSSQELAGDATVVVLVGADKAP
jgi:hypothetical protein